MTTGHRPKIISVANRNGKLGVKPKKMRSIIIIDRNRSTWPDETTYLEKVSTYKKSIFHILDISMWNYYYIYK